MTETETCACTLTIPDPNCKDGPWLFSRMEPVLNLAKHPEFFELAANQRYEMWRWFNEAANTYLKHVNFHLPPINYAKKHRDSKTRKPCQNCKKETTWILWLHPKSGTVLSCGLCKEAKDLQVAVLKWKLELAKDSSAKFAFNQVMNWVGEYQTFTELDQNIEEWAMGTLESEVWRSYSRLYGIILADYKAPYKLEKKG